MKLSSLCAGVFHYRWSVVLRASYKVQQHINPNFGEDKSTGTEVSEPNTIAIWFSFIKIHHIRIEDIMLSF